MAGKIFINYRRGDDPGFTGRLFDYLERNFSSEQLFIDVDNISAGEDFARVLDAQVAQCDVMLSVIGQDWLDARAKDGSRRLDSEQDFVRFEIESALRLDKRVIPVLVNQAQMPREDLLPPSLAAFARRNAVRITHERFRADAQGLVGVLKRAIAEVEANRQARVEQLAEMARREQAALAAEAARQNELDAAALLQKGRLDPDAEVAALERRIAEIKSREAARRADEARARDRATVPAPAGHVPPPVGPTPIRPGQAPPAPRLPASVETSVVDGQITDGRRYPFLHSRESWTGVLFLLIGGVGIAAGPGFQSKSSGYPAFIAGALMLVGLVALLKAGLSERSAVERVQWRTPVFVIAACAAFGALLDLVGVVAALVVLGALSFAAAPYDRFDWRAVATFVFVIGGVASLFIWGLKLPLPLFGRLLAG